MQRGKTVVQGGLENLKKKKVKGKGEKERYIDLNTEFQRTARRDKKAFLSDQCKEIEENNRMTSDLFKKIRDTKGTFHAQMGTTKDRNGMDLTEAEDIKKRWQQYTELYKKALETSLVVQWLRLCASNAGCLDSIPDQGTRFCMPQLKDSTFFNKN